MSVSLKELLERAGYDIENNVDDARWFLGQQEEMEELLEVANDLDDEYTEYGYYEDEMREQDKLPLTFEEWKELK